MIVLSGWVLGCTPAAGGGRHDAAAASDVGPAGDAPEATDVRAVVADAGCPAQPPQGGGCERGTMCSYFQGTCMTSCGCTFSREWSCINNCGPPARCPATPPVTGDRCGGLSQHPCDWTVACERVACTCRQLEIGAPFEWTCSRGSLSPADGGGDGGSCSAADARHEDGAR